MRAWLLLPLLTSTFGLGCDRRKPLPKERDAGPAVMVVDSRRATTGTATTQLGNSAHQPLDAESEPNDDVAHAQPLPVGHGISGKLLRTGTKNDVDLFSFVEPGSSTDGGAGFDEVRLTLTPTTVAVGEEGGALDVALEVLDGDGGRLLSIDDAAPGEAEIYPNLAATPGSTYFVRVSASLHGNKAAPPAAQGGYTLTVERSPATDGAEREPNDKAAQATPHVGEAGDSHGYFGRRKDEDWLRVPTSGGALLKLELGPVENVAPKLRVEANGVPLARAETNKGGELRLRNVGIPAGATEVLVQISGDGRNPTNLWQLRAGPEAALEGAESEPNDTLATATPIADGVTLSGFLWPGDVDYYCTAKIAGGFSAQLEGVDGVDLKLEEVRSSATNPGKVDVVAKTDAHKVGQGEELPTSPRSSDGTCYRVTGRSRDTAFDAPYRFTVRPAP